MERVWRQQSYRVEYESMRNRLALLDGVKGVDRRDGGRIATWLSTWHMGVRT